MSQDPLEAGGGLRRTLGAPFSAPARFQLQLQTEKAELAEILKVVSGQNAKAMYETGDLGVGILSCGQSIGTAYDIPTIQELIDRIISQASETARKLAS